MAKNTINIKWRRLYNWLWFLWKAWTYQPNLRPLKHLYRTAPFFVNSSNYKWCETCSDIIWGTLNSASAIPSYHRPLVTGLFIRPCAYFYILSTIVNCRSMSSQVTAAIFTASLPLDEDVMSHVNGFRIMSNVSCSLVYSLMSTFWYVSSVVSMQCAPVWSRIGSTKIELIDLLSELI